MKSLMKRTRIWKLVCICLVLGMCFIMFRNNSAVYYYASLITIVSKVDDSLRGGFAGHAIEIEVNVVRNQLMTDGSTNTVPLVPMWQHSYQENDPKPTLREHIHKAMDAVSPIFIRLKNIQYEPNKIPKIIHQQWKDNNIPDDTKQWVKKWQETNPDWTYMFWTDQSARDFVASYYPMLLEQYDNYAYSVQKADMFRYILLFAFGGVYADIDMEPLKSLNPIRDWAPCIIATEPDVHAHVIARLATEATNNTLASNALMACEPTHPYIFFLISELLKNWQERSKMRHFRNTIDKCPLEETLGCTGPYIESVALAFYQRSYGDLLKQYPEENVIAAPAKYFLPTFADRVIRNLKIICRNTKMKLNNIGKMICDDMNKNGFKNPDIPKESMTNHHWYDSYHFKGERATVPLQSILSNVVMFPMTDFEIVMKRTITLFSET